MDEKIKIPRAPLNRYDYGILGVLAMGVTLLLLVLTGVFFGGCAYDSSLAYDHYDPVSIVETPSRNLNERIVSVYNGRPYDVVVDIRCDYSVVSPNTRYHVWVNKMSHETIYVMVYPPRRWRHVQLCEITRWYRK